MTGIRHLARGGRPTLRAVAAAHAAYYLPTALLPFASRRAFESITGPKAEWWLVQTVAVLIGSIGGAIALSARCEAPPKEIVALAIAAAGGLCAIDAVYVARGRIQGVYLVDAAVELGLLTGWTCAAARNRGPVR